MTTNYLAKSEKDLPGIAEQLINIVDKPKVILFYGEMGAGKTTFIRSLCAELGIEETISSPTFSLVNEYLTKNGKTVFHFDFYRIETPEEALDMGVEEYFYSGNYCLVEWPDKIAAYLPDDAVKVEVLVEDDESRKIVLHA